MSTIYVMKRKGMSMRCLCGHKFTSFYIFISLMFSLLSFSSSCAQSSSPGFSTQKRDKVRSPIGSQAQVATSRPPSSKEEREIRNTETLSGWVISSLKEVVAQHDRPNKGFIHYDLFKLDSTSEKILIGNGEAKLTMGKQEIIWKPMDLEWTIVQLAYLALIEGLKEGELTDVEILRSFYPSVSRPEKVAFTIRGKQLNGYSYMTLNGSSVKWTTGRGFVTDDGSQVDIIAVERKQGKNKDTLVKIYTSNGRQ